MQTQERTFQIPREIFYLMVGLIAGGILGYATLIAAYSDSPLLRGNFGQGFVFWLTWGLGIVGAVMGIQLAASRPTLFESFLLWIGLCGSFIFLTLLTFTRNGVMTGNIALPTLGLTFLSVGFVPGEILSHLVFRLAVRKTQAPSPSP